MSFTVLAKSKSVVLFLLIFLLSKQVLELGEHPGHEPLFACRSSRRLEVFLVSSPSYVRTKYVATELWISQAGTKTMPKW